MKTSYLSNRHIGVSAAEQKEMLQEIGLKSFDELFKNIDAGIRLREDLDLPNGLNEIETKQRLLSLAGQNSTTIGNAYFIGGGCYNKFSPACISYLTQRSEFLTAYTPYQPEISQGSLQSIYEYQTMIARLTGMDIANASLYDAGSACAEAVLMAYRISKGKKIRLLFQIN